MGRKKENERERWALVVNSNPDLLQMFSGAVEELLPGVRCVAEQDLARAQAQVQDWGIQRCSVIICSPTAVPDRNQPPALDARDLHGIEFVRRLRAAHGDAPPVIFPAAFTDAERASALAGLSNVRCVGMKELYKNLRREIDNFVLGKNDPRNYHLDVDILLDSEQPSRWFMRGPHGATSEETGVIDMQKRDLADLLTLSELAHAGSEAFLRLLGRRVYETVMNPARSDGLKQKLDDSVELLGGMEHARIRFNVDAHTQRIQWETLVMPDRTTSELEFCMMKAPIFRKLGKRGGRQPLFQDRMRRAEPVDCLLIQGCARAFAVGAPHSRSFLDIAGAVEEIDWLEEFLDVNREQYGIGTVTVLRYGEQPGSFAAAIEQALTDREYELVHYSGHSALDAAGQACLFFGGGAGEQVDVAKFSRWARDVQFVYLSSCQSANAQFILKLVDKDVPAVIGYAWHVQDDVALAFARTFYHELLAGGRDRRRLEYSFMAAKQDLHARWPGSPHWAAPLLFMQVMDAESVAAF